MNDVSNHLPNRPISIEQTYGLMQPPRQGVGFVNPVFVDEDGDCVCAYLEINGEMTAIAFNGCEWQQLEVATADVDAALHGEEYAKGFIDDIVEEANDIVQAKTTSVEPEVQREAPPGYQSKICIRHHPLSPTDFQELQSWPQLSDCVAILGNREAGIVGVTLSERQLNVEDEENVVFMYFNPEKGTWRIIDSVDLGGLTGMADYLHEETKKKLQEHYDQIDVITGPRN